MRKTKAKDLPIVGWREWISLPDLGIEHIKAKIDTGARSSSLHAFDVKSFVRNGKEYVRFKIRPAQRSHDFETEAEALVLDRRSIRSSSGKASQRVVIQTTLSISGRSWPIELTLANRDEMGFRMLLGREAIRNRWIVDAGRSFLAGVPPFVKKRKTKQKKHISKIR